MSAEVLQLCRFSPSLERDLRARFTVHSWCDLEDRPGFLARRAAAIRAVVTGGHVGIPTELMSALPHLGLVAINGVGFDRVDLDEARRRGIQVTTTPGVLTADVADLAVGLVIALLRAVPQADRFVREGLWAEGELPLGRKVSGRAFGIVGLGNIGQAIAERLKAFGPVSYCDLNPKPVSYPFLPDIVDLARASDVLVLTTTAGPSTFRIVGRQVLDALGPSGYVINVARGSLVDESELGAALREGRIAGAALDVFDNEPNVHEQLRSAPNVVLTPHIASATVETREAMARAVLDNLENFFAGRPLTGALT